MQLEQLIGNESAKAFLRGPAKELQVLLFSGPEGVGKKSFVRAFIQDKWDKVHAWKIANDLHPDVRFIQPEGKTHMHSVASLREMMAEAGLLPFEAKERMFIIESAERMLPTSANLLLKILEEPPAHVTFILLTAHEEEMLPTLLSRTVKVSFQAIDPGEIRKELERLGFPTEKVQEAIQASHGSFSHSLAIIKGSSDSVRDLFQNILASFFLKKNSPAFVEALDKLAKLMEKQEEEVSSQIMDHLFEDLLQHLSDLHKSSIQQLQPIALPSLESAMTCVEEARLATQRHTKPKVVLEQLFTKLLAKKAW